MKILGEQREFQQFSGDEPIVLDKNVARFSLEKLRNCSIFEAYKILHYKRKFDEGFFRLYWKGIFRDSSKYIQKIEINDRWKHCVLMEHLIAEYLLKIQKVSFDDDWMYIGQHEFSGNRIIVGHGRGIVLSRFVPGDIFREADCTKLYLKRLHIFEPKIFSAIEDAPDATIVSLRDILKFAKNSASVRPIFENDYTFIKNFLRIVIVVLCIFCACNAYELYSQKNDFKWNYNNKISNGDITIYVKHNRHAQLKTLLQNLKDDICWEKIGEFCSRNGLKVQKILITRDSVKIKTTIPVEKLKELKNLKVDCSINSDYEELGTDTTAEAVIWLK